jgi:malic enzyme
VNVQFEPFAILTLVVAFPCSQASLGIAQLCVMAMQAEGTSVEDARGKIWMVDSKGLIVKDRPDGGVTGHKVLYAKNHTPIKNLEAVVKQVKPSVIIGELLHVALNIMLSGSLSA